MNRFHVFGLTGSRKAGVALVCFLLIFMFISCGKKGAPSPPRLGPPLPVRDLTMDLTDDFLTLSWTVPTGSKKVVASLAGFHVYKSKTPVSAEECKGCPILFSRVADIPIQGEIPGQDTVTYTETIEKGFQYIYKVTVYSHTGAVSRDSKLIRFTF